MLLDELCDPNCVLYDLDSTIHDIEGMKQLEIRWARSVARLDGPALCRDHDDVADRILHVVVRVQVRWMEAGEDLLSPPANPSPRRIDAGGIAEDQAARLLSPAPPPKVQG